MASYSFITEWKLKAPLADVWQTIRESSEWPRWWKGVVSVKEITPGNEHRIGNISDLVWKSFLPYHLCFRSTVVKVIPMEYMEGDVVGELEGKGRWYFYYNDGITTVRYHWDVKTTKSWMNFFAPLLKGIFKWNHDVVMQWGGEGLAKKLNTTLMNNQ
jgi:hypothetical protein